MELEEFSRTKEFATIIVFDVLIANSDRVNRNVLYSKGVGCCVIDHDKAFIDENWTRKFLADNINAIPQTVFETMLKFANQNAQKNIKNLALDWEGKLTAGDVNELDEIAQWGCIDSDDIDALKSYIVNRSCILSSLVQSVLDRNQ